MGRDSRIVKVQLSLAASDGTRRALIYDESKEWMLEDVAAPGLVVLVGNAPKAFFWAHINADRMLELDAPAPYQVW